MMPFRKIAAASDGTLIRAYFTENKPEPSAAAEPLTPGRLLEPGERLTAYYTGQDSRATWRPDMPVAAARALGIDATRMPLDTELDRLFEAKRGDTGEAWSKQKRTVSVYDFAFQPHKSVTLAAEFAEMPAEKAAILNAIDRAGDQAMRYVARELGWARRGDGGKDGAEPGAVGWVSFRHHTARPTLAIQDGRDGATYLADSKVVVDPHAHIHYALFNMVATEDGRVGSLDTQRLQSRVHEFGSWAQVCLGNELRRLGIGIRYDKDEKAVVIEAIPDFASNAFSKGHRHVLQAAKAFAKRQGLDWDDLSAGSKNRILNGSAVADRLAKHQGKSDPTIWREEAAAIGWEHTTVLEGVRHRALTDGERFDLAHEFAARHLAIAFETAAVLSREKVRELAARGLIGTGGKEPDDIDRVVELLETRGIELKGERVALVTGLSGEAVRVTNTAQIRIEEDLATLAGVASLDTSRALPADALRTAIANSGLDLTTEPEHGKAQRAAIHALGQGGALTVLTGVAGSGKTTLLQPLVVAWRADDRLAEGGREVVGLSTAWRQADALEDAGIERRFSTTSMLRAIEAGEFTPDRNTVLVIDELSQVGPRSMLRLLELRAHTGMEIKGLGDREQAQSIEAGDTIEILRRSLAQEALPELLTTVRQQTERGRVIAGLFRGAEMPPRTPKEVRQRQRIAEVTTALLMKRKDGTALLVGGDEDQVIGRVADLYVRRRDHLMAAGSRRGVTVTVPTNKDAMSVSAAIRERLKARGEIGRDEIVYHAIDQRGEMYELAVAIGDKLRLFRSTYGTSGKRGSTIGRNGDVVEVLARTNTGLRLRNKKGEVADVEWRRMIDAGTGRLMLGYGHALTIDAAQGLTSDETIAAYPRGTAGLTAFKAYVAESRAQGMTWTMISEAAVHDAIRRGMALGDATPVTTETIWERVAEDMASKPYKALGMDLGRTARADREHAVDTFIAMNLRLEAMQARGRDAGLEVRKQLEASRAEQRLAGTTTALEGRLQANQAGLAEVGAAARVNDRSHRVRSFVRSQGEDDQPDARLGGQVRREVQAMVVQHEMTRRLAGLDEALRRNAATLGAIGEGLAGRHLRELRTEAEATRLALERAKGPSSPSPGM